MKNKSRKTKSNIVIKIILLLVIIVSVINITSAQVKLSKRRAQLAEYEEQAEQLRLSNDELAKLLEDGSYDDLIERALRENGYVNADEKVYADIAGN